MSMRYGPARSMRFKKRYRSKTGYNQAYKKRRYNYQSSRKERKTHNVKIGPGDSPINSTAPRVMNLVAAGTSAETRIGDTMVMTKIGLKICLLAKGTTVNHCYRFMLLWDTQPNKAVATLNDILHGLAPHDPTDFLELDGRKRFITVWNSHAFNVGANTNDNDSRTFEFYCKCQAETVWSDSGGTVASLVSGALLLLTISDGVSAAESFDGTYQLRLRFTDGQYAGRPKFFQRRNIGSLMTT